MHPLARAVVVVLLVAACGGKARTSQPPPHSGNMYRGYASWYGEPQMTASGERFDKHALTAAHRSLPLATVVRVTNLANGRHVLLRINDRGPYAGGRIIDVSREAAELLGMKQDGVAQVRLEVFTADQVKTLAASTRSFRTE